MKTITISLSDDELQQLQEMAARSNVAPEELARVGIEELLKHPDEAFRNASDYILRKNAELY